MNKYKITRILGYLLLIVTVLMVLSGFGITKYQIVQKLTFGLLGKANSFKLHSFLAIPFILLTLYHVIFYHQGKIKKLFKKNK